MKKIKFILIMLFATAGMPLLHSQVFSYAVDTVYVAKDSVTILNPRGHVFSVGDSVENWIWYVSNDSIAWKQLWGLSGNMVTGDSVMLDTLPVYKYYLAYLQPGQKISQIVWRINHIIYRALRPPKITNNYGVNKKDILLLRLDTLRIFYAFDGLQPDTVVWYRLRVQNYGLWGSDIVNMPVSVKGYYFAAGYVYNRRGEVIDYVCSDTVFVNFQHPLWKVIFKSWAGSNDGKPRRIDTLLIDTCMREYIIDTLRFAVGDGYKYQFIPVIQPFDREYNFTYRWEHDGFAIVRGKDSILEFNPVGFQHSGNYKFFASIVDGRSSMNYGSAIFRITAALHTGNSDIPNNLIEKGVIYGITGSVIKRGVSGRFADIVRTVYLPAGVYFLRDKGTTYKFIKH